MQFQILNNVCVLCTCTLHKSTCGGFLLMSFPLSVLSFTSQHLKAQHQREWFYHLTSLSRKMQLRCRAEQSIFHMKLELGCNGSFYDFNYTIYMPLCISTVTADDCPSLNQVLLFKGSFSIPLSPSAC